MTGEVVCLFCKRPDTEEYHFYPERDGETGGCRSVPLSEFLDKEYEAIQSLREELEEGRKERVEMADRAVEVLTAIKHLQERTIECQN